MKKENKDNLYFPVYQRLEKEVLELSSAIYFDDDQLDVYSLSVLDLIIKVSVELESIAKDIYRNELRQESSSSGKCINWMEENWKISAKAIQIVTPNFHLEKKLMPTFCPFDYKNGSEQDYYSVYNAIKHERAKNYKKARIEILLRVLGALYILNLYYDDKRIYLDDLHARNLDKTGGSKIFSFFIAPCADAMVTLSQQNMDANRCIYKIKQHDEGYGFRINYMDRYGEFHNPVLISGSTEFQEFVPKCIGMKMGLDDVVDIWVGREKNKKEEIINNFWKDYKVSRIYSVDAEKLKPTYWAELNKG